MQSTTNQPVYQTVASSLAPIVQCVVAVGIVAYVARHSEIPYIVPYLIIMLSFSLFDQMIRGRHPNVFVELLNPSASLSDKMTFVGGGLLLAVHFCIALADVGLYHWSVPLPAWTHVVGLVAMVLGFLFAAWAMLLNPFFSPVVRVQQERAHRVVSAGPYSVVRHPSYLGLSVGAIASGFALGSYWSLIPVLLFILLYVRRARLEDQRLTAELDGYAQYAQRVRRRIIPFVW